MAESRVARERDLDRFLTFDACVAIAITLLVLPLAEAATDGFVLALAITLTFPATGYYPLLLLADPAVRAWRPARGGGKRTAHMGE